ncbi:MAG: glycosyltransferase family 4 protein, partial [Planctomycetota bacterium]
FKTEGILRSELLLFPYGIVQGFYRNWRWKKRNEGPLQAISGLNREKKEMKRYKLAFVIERYFEFGGLQRDMRRFALACAAKGHDVTVFTDRWEGSDEPSITVEIVDFRMISNHRTMKKNEAFVHALRNENTFDCIVGFNRVGGLDVYFGGDPCLKAKLERQRHMWRRFLPRYRTYLELERGVFGPDSDAVLMLINPSEAETIQRIYHTDSERICLLPPGIDRERFSANPLPGEKRNQFRKELGVQDDELMVLTVGSSFHTKGIDRAIYAIASLPDALKNRCRYIVVGLGKEKKYRAIAHKAGIGDRVTFTGGRQDVPNFYYAADVLLHPARSENAGTALLEAMVTGLPVIVTENCGYAHYIQEANAGQVCGKPFEQTQLNTVLRDVLANDAQRQEYAKNGRDYCPNADIYSRFEKGVDVIIKRAEKSASEAHE